MYAVIESGGKQHRVEEGEILQLEKLDAAAGEKVKFDRILLVGEGKSVKIGTPYVEGSRVEAEVTRQGRADKVKIIKFRRRKHSLAKPSDPFKTFLRAAIASSSSESKSKAVPELSLIHI